MKTFHQIKRLLMPALFSLFSLSAHAQWDSLRLPCRPNIQTLQAWQGKIYATAQGGAVFESTDQGASWRFVFDHLNFRINPNSGGFFSYNIQYGSSLFSYTPTHWFNGFGTSLVPFTDPSVFQSGMAFSHDTAYFFKGNELLRFVPGPPSGWSTVPLPANFYPNNLFVSDNHFWIANSQLALHSPNKGASWDTVATDPQGTLSMAAAGDTILLCYFNDQLQTRVLARTVNQGQNWATTTAQPNIRTIRGGSPFLGIDNTGQQAWYSSNGLTSWQAISTEFPPNALLFAGNNTIAAQNFGIQVFANGQWTEPTLGAGIPDEMNFVQVYLRKAGNTLLFGGDPGGHGRFQRPDGAGAWTKSATGYFADRTVQRGNQLIGCGRYGTYRAQLGGPTFDWTLLNTQTGYLFESGGQLYLGNTSTGTIYRSNDNGQTWTARGTAPGTDFLHSFAAEGGKFYMRIGADLMESADEGLSWAKRYTFSLNFDIPGAGKLVGLNGNLFLTHGETRQILRSQDGGMSFSQISAPQNPNFGPYRLRNVGGQLFFFNGDDKLYRSDNLGQSWKTVKPPYMGFNFDPSMIYSALSIADNQLYLFDPARGAAWQADLAELEPSPCDAVYINLPPVSCYLAGDLDVYLPGNMQCTWLEDGVQVQQGSFWYVNFPEKNGSTYKLIITDPVSGCSVSDETTIKLPTANISYKPLMSCDEQFQTLDLSGSSTGPGYEHRIYGQVAPDNIYFQYVNIFDAAGQPSNPNPPVVQPGYYVLQVYDKQVGCYMNDTAYIQHAVPNPLASVDATDASCGQNDGSASVQINSNPALTTIAWSNGASGTSVASLAPGWYSVTVSQGFCAGHDNFEVVEDPACKVTIRGSVVYDKNADCAADGPFDPKGIMLHLLPDDTYTYTDQFGDYEFIRPPGGYTVEFVDKLHYEVHCPGSGNYVLSLPGFGSLSENNDFFVKKRTAPNLGIVVTPGPAVRGTNMATKLTVCNFSSETATDVSLVWNFDPLTTNPSTSGLFQFIDYPTHTAVASNLTYNTYPTCFTYTLGLHIPANAPLGEVLHFSMDILPVGNDFFPADNHVEWSQTVVGSYDPNDKTVAPGDTERGGKIFEQDSVLHYNIRFQNTGNHVAYTVELRDTLDPQLDVTSITPGAFSHPYGAELRFAGNNVLVVRFENIYLPDSLTDPNGSQGFFSFSIRRKPGLAPGAVIRNRAAIYFDFNEPVLTNTVESILSAPLSIQSPTNFSSVLVYPNPSTGSFSAILPEPAPGGMVLRLFDLAGRPAYEQRAAAGIREQELPVTGLPAGMYFLQAVSEGRVLGVARVMRE